MTRFMLLCGSLLLLAAGSSAQAPGERALPRRGWFGVALAPHAGGAVVTGVTDGSSAAAAGVRGGDVIRTVDGAAMRTPEDIITAISRHAPGSAAAVGFTRDGDTRELSVVLRSLPEETMAGAAFEYGSVRISDGARLRTIVSVPARSGRFPAVLLLQGGGCGSVDLPMAPGSGQPGLVRTIASRGFVTMRVEKSGVGDSTGTPCAEIGYLQELEGYRAALAALTSHRSVDREQVFLLGISLGGVFAPVLAGETPVRGIIVYGTPSNPPAPYPGRSERFFREFAAVDVPAAWSRVDARVLSVYGEFDETAPRDHHARIAAIVNERRPGSAVLEELRGLDHCWTRHATQEKSQGNCGRGEEVPALADTILAFLARS